MGGQVTGCRLLELTRAFTDLDCDGQLLPFAQHDDWNLGIGIGLTDQTDQRGHSLHFLSIPSNDHIVNLHASVDRWRLARSELPNDGTAFHR